MQDWFLEVLSLDTFIKMLDPFMVELSESIVRLLTACVKSFNIVPDLLVIVTSVSHIRFPRLVIGPLFVEATAKLVAAIDGTTDSEFLNQQRTAFKCLAELLGELAEQFVAEVYDCERQLLTILRKAAKIDFDSDPDAVEYWRSQRELLCGAIPPDPVFKHLAAAQKDEAERSRGLSFFAELVRAHPVLLQHEGTEPLLTEVIGLLSGANFELKHASLRICLAAVNSGSPAHCTHIIGAGFIEEIVDALSWDPDDKFVRRALETISCLLAKFGREARQEVVQRFIGAGLINELDDLAASGCLSEYVVCRCECVRAVVTGEQEEDDG
jgi:hypothetical protein